MAKKIKIIVAFISLSICLCLMSNTYSRYVAGTTGNVEALFSKWQILVNSTDITNSIDSTVDIVPIIDEDVNIAANTVAPSSKGHFDIIIDPSNVDVSFSYNISLAIQNQDMPDLKITGYSYVPADYNEEDNNLEIITTEDNIIEEIMNYEKETPGFKFNSFTIRVYFEWLEGTGETMNNEADTVVGNQAVVEDMSLMISANIEFEQIIQEINNDL